MKKVMEPYFVLNGSIYFTDGVAEVLYADFQFNELANRVCEALNQCYVEAYTDGYNASANEKYDKLVSQNTSLMLKVHRLTRELEDCKNDSMSRVQP